METLQERYAKDKVYTFCGTILIALNPYKSIAEKAYTPSIMQQYRGRSIGEDPPHIFAIADQAYRDLLGGKRSVSVVISGESGAGKTETTKLILNYISALNSEPTAVEAKLIESAVLLEAFGNAKTVRNNNSSRFGKLIKILFDDRSGLIAGAEIETYLLERSRVSHQDASERNFHIFYMLAEGAGPEERSKLQLERAQHYDFIKGCVDLGLDEKDELRQLKDGLLLFGFSQGEREAIFAICAAILHLGNVKFGYHQAKLVATVETPQELEAAAKLLQLSAADLGKVLVERQLNVRGQKIRKGLTAEEAAGTRDALCRMIYGAMFDWIVGKLNVGLKTKGEPTSKFLGVLDIFGFENFASNSFEQLCINYANEKLHALFVDHVFTLEQEEYAREGLKWTPLSTQDNEECIALIENKVGLFALLDEESKLQAGTDDSYMKKLVSNYGKGNKYWKTSRLNASKAFVVSHFAEEVTYTVDGFREKNQNTLADDVKALVVTSKLPLLSHLLQQQGDGSTGEKGPSTPTTTPGGSGAARGTNTTASIFRRQLMALKSTLDCTTPYFVRCIKPNILQKPNCFEETLVNSQLAYSGMLETVRIRQQGYAFRIEYEDVYRLYRPMGITEATKVEADRFMGDLVKKKTISPKHFAVGKTKLFLKTDGQLALEAGLKRAVRRHAVLIQAWVRMWMARTRFRLVVEKAMVLQRNIRAMQINKRLRRRVMVALVCADYCERQREIAREKAARLIQQNVRAIWVNRHLKRCVVASLCVTRFCEAERKRNEAERQRKLREEAARKKAAEEAERKRLAEEKERLKALDAVERKKQEEELERKHRERKEAEAKAEAQRLQEEEEREAARLIEDEIRRKDATESEIERLDQAEEEAKAAAAATTTAPALPPKSQPRRAAPLPPKGSAASAAAAAAKPRASYATSVSPPSGGARSSASSRGSSGYSEVDTEIEGQLAAIAALQGPDDPVELLNFAKSLQRKVKGQLPEIADAMYAKAIECYKRGLEKYEDCDAYVNAGTALINHANLRFIMASYGSKTQACVPLLSLAEKMLERAMTLGLDAEGKEAIALRVLKCSELKDQALAEDMKKLTPQHRAKLIADVKAKLEALKPQERVGKVQREEKGLMGRTVWKDFVLVLSPATIQLFVKSQNEKPKLDVLLADVTAAKETVVNGKQAFAVVTATQFFPFAVKDRGEMEQWINGINTNMQRLKLQGQVRSLESLN